MGTRQDHENQAIEDLRSYGRSLVDAVSTGRTEAMVGRALSARQRPHRPRRLVLALATLGLLAVSNVGLAAVADPAAPGDLLYPLDRGYERAGDLFGGWLFGAGNRTQERLAESEAINGRGDTEEAIAFLRAELDVESSDAELLVAAIDRLKSQGNQGQGSQGSQNDSGPATPAETAPGQVDDDGNGQSQPNPSDTAPGNGQGDETGSSPSDTAPGQNKDNGSKENPSDDAPGQNQDTTTTSVAPGTGNGNGNNGNGNGNGNNGPGNDGP
jgi:hypothetical protein